MHSAYDGTTKIYAKNYLLNQQSHWLLESQGHSVNQFTICTGNDYQHQLNSEHITLIDQTEAIFSQTHSKAFQDRQLIGSILDCITVASEYNHKSRLIEATSMTDTAWSLLDYVCNIATKHAKLARIFINKQIFMRIEVSMSMLLVVVLHPFFVMHAHHLIMLLPPAKALCKDLPTWPMH